MDVDRLTIDPPLYLIGKMYACWRCGAKMPVVAILAPKVEGTAGEICRLSGITELPEAILAYIIRAVCEITFRRVSKTGYCWRTPYLVLTSLILGSKKKRP